MSFKPSIILRTRKDLVTALAEEGLPRSTPSLLQFEGNKVIKYPRFGIKRGQNGFDRLYTDTEIAEAVSSVRTHSVNRQSFGNK